MSRLLATMAFCGVAAAAFAQERGSIPPGEARDESRPAEGAIVGGAIDEDTDTSRRLPAEDIARCKQLTGTLREQCLRDLDAGAGDTQPSAPARPAPVPRDPLTEPPLQNPQPR